ncbi:MAG TPA: MFS transporter [Nitrososphaerales archaeon]|nr:MFS transporter [Nitrososphaerales archaeon]
MPEEEKDQGGDPADKEEDFGHMVIARMDRIPIWAFPTSLILIIGSGYFFTFFDITDIGFAMPAIAEQFQLTGSETLFVALAVGLVGYILGSYAIGTLADRYGRFNTMLATIALTAIGSFGDAASTDLVTLSIWRFVTGMGVGADLNLVSTYIGELSPPNIRGRMSVLTFFIGIIGQAVTPFVALAIVPTYAIGWRVLFVIGGIIAVIALAARSQLPESPRWLVLHGRAKKADEIVTRMEEFARKKGVKLEEPEVKAISKEKGKFPTAYLFHRPYSTRLILLASMWFFWYIGNYGFLGDAATLLSSQNITIAGSIYYLAIGALGYPVGAVVMLVLADRVERKRLILGSTVVWLVGMLSFGSLASDVAIASGSFLASLALGMYLQVAYTFTVESYPTRARTSGFALSDGVGHLGGAVGALALPLLVTAVGFQGGFSVIGLTGLAAGVLAMAGPAATRKHLEQVSA